MNVSLSLDKRCTACNMERKPKNLRFDPKDFKPYCANPWSCNEDHPNSPKNLIRNQKETMLVEHAQAHAAYETYLRLHYANSDRVQQMHKMLKHPTQFRITDPEQANYLLDLQEQIDAGSLAEVIRYCIDFTRERLAIENYHGAVKVEQVKHDKEQTAQRTVASINDPAPKAANANDDLEF